MFAASVVDTTSAHAYCGFEIDAAVDLNEDRGFANRDPTQRIVEALRQQQAWFDSILDRDVSVEVRFLGGHPDSPKVTRCAVLARHSAVGGSDRPGAAAEVVERAKNWVHRAIGSSGSGPGHVRATPLTETSLRTFLYPLDPGPSGRAEIRKRIDSSVPNRPDARVPRYWSVSPYRSMPHSWATLLSALADCSSPTMLTVNAERQYQHLDARIEKLDTLATFFGRMAREGEIQGAIYSGQKKLAPDAFAQHAERSLREMIGRYRGGLVSMRIAVSSADALSDGFLSLVGSTISPADTVDRLPGVDAPVTGASFVVARPDEAQAPTFDLNTQTLSRSRWGEFDFPNDFSALVTALTTVDVSEGLAAFRLPIAENGAIRGFPVRRPQFGAAVSRDAAIGRQLRLGSQRSSGSGASDLSIPLDDLTMHAFVVGTTGSGKTTTMLGLLTQLNEHEIPWLVIEPVNASGDDYRWFLDQPGCETLTVFTAGDETLAPLRLNPLQVPEGATVGEHLTALLGSFDAAFALWDPLPAIYRSALEQTYFEAGFTMDDRGGDREWPTLRDLLDEMRRVTDDLEYSGEVRSNIIAASRVRLEQLLSGPMRSIFDCRRSTPIADILAAPAVIELARVGSSNEKEVAFVIAILLSVIAEHRRGEESSRELRHVIVVEEAHKLLKRPVAGPAEKGDASQAASQLFGNLLAEVRKAGQGLIIVDQDPGKLISDAYKNTNLKIMHRLPADEDRRLIGGSMRFDEDHIREAAGLHRFHAFVFAEGYDRPGLVELPNTRLGSDAPLPGDDEVAERFERTRNRLPGLEASMEPYDACAGCQSQCVHRSRSHALASRRQTQENFWTIAPGLRERNPDAYRQLETLFRSEGVSGSADEVRCALVHLSMASFDSGFKEFVQDCMTKLEGAR